MSKARNIADSTTKLVMPTYASTSAANTAGVNSEGSTIYDSGQYVLKTYASGDWRTSGDKPEFSSTLDFFGDGTAISLHQLNNSSADTGGVYGATLVGSPTYVTESKFGTHSIDTRGNGKYIDIPGLPRVFAVSFWVYIPNTLSGTSYLVDFRHDAPGNGRGYLYTNPNREISLANDTTATDRIGDIYVNGSLLKGGYQFSLNTWHHVVVSINNINATHELWDQGLRFGNRSDGTTEGGIGYFDQIRTFATSLDGDRVLQLYNESEAP